MFLTFLELEDKNRDLNNHIFELKKTFNSLNFRGNKLKMLLYLLKVNNTLYHYPIKFQSLLLTSSESESYFN